MKPDKKYMNIECNNDFDYNFVPLQNNFNFRCNQSSLTPFFKVNNSIFDHEPNNNFNFDFRGDINSSNLFPDETIESQLYCYIDQLGKNCYKKNSNIEKDNPSELTPDKVLRGFDLDLNENEDLERVNSDNDVNRIYLKIEEKNPNLLTTLSLYGIPYPIARVMIKRIIKLSLQYYKER
ncbi:hypothetical protein NE172_09985 [Clostridium botulinum]|uniref:Uncharacterized protein n=1 Tax=Clostridium botulinum TaxID=1491 RepID=A0A6B4JLU0_CLOBO|nr:hypothetical protein [Clostridium botulinum]EES48219.1 conserved hypothetical protein [Clostridium botulinum E1 str. 'BoNT E Beluga']MBN1070208.1 hypothetical protein [Clostridium botulinum]MBY6761270.1 hypothetical protein [Clostridium botulinum]MBY6920396.1 hypothetical protein [Clostridium botulinum]MCR1131288.1 hypothetical protein [Clostridium botulinum]